MKIFNIVLTSSLLIATSATAFSAKVKEPSSVKGTSVGTYAKPGAPVDIRYESQHVDAGDSSVVSIVLTSSVSMGNMKVKLKVDKGLNDLSHSKKHLSFDLSEGKKEYPLHLEVSADEDGLYYISVLVSIKGQGMRAFAVPVYVGDAVDKTKKTVAGYRNIEKTDKGTTISVSAAQESITEE